MQCTCQSSRRAVIEAKSTLVRWPPAPIQAHISAVDKAIDAELAARAGRQPCL